MARTRLWPRTSFLLTSPPTLLLHIQIIVQAASSASMTLRRKLLCFGPNQRNYFTNNIFCATYFRQLFAFLDGRIHFGVGNRRKPMCPPVTVVRICFLPCCPLFSSPPLLSVCVCTYFLVLGFFLFGISLISSKVTYQLILH